LKILVVEDFTPMREAISRGLSLEGHEAIPCGDGAEGLDRVLRIDPDLVVLDIMLPSIDGIEFLHRLRSVGSTTPILVLTARDSLSDRVEGLDAGADDYLVKPFAFTEFMARVRALLRRGRENQRQCVADLSIDPMRRLAWRAGGEIALTPREFAVLELLVREQGKPVSRDEIRQRIYPDSETASSNVVEVFVGNLRRKLEDGGHPRILHTRRGFGYQLQATPP